MKHILAVLCAAAELAVVAVPAHAVNLLTNGDFETGDFTSWTTNVQPGSGGSLAVVSNDGNVGFGSPYSASPYAFNPAGGNLFAISDQFTPGSYSLTQSFTLSSAAVVKVSFDFFANNWASGIYNNGRDYTDVPNQNAEVDILTGNADPFTNSTGIVATLYGPGADSLTGNPNPWVTYDDTLSLGAGTYQVRFAETDNQNLFQIGVDNVSVSVESSSPVPEASSWGMMLIGFAGLGCAALRQKQKPSIHQNDVAY